MNENQSDIIYRDDVIALIGQFVKNGLNADFAAAICDAVDLIPAVETHEVFLRTVEAK